MTARVSASAPVKSSPCVSCFWILLLVLPPLLKPPSRRTCSINVSKLSFSQPCLSPRPAYVCVGEGGRRGSGGGGGGGGGVCAVSVTVRRPAFPPCAVDERSRNPLYSSSAFYLFQWQSTITVTTTVITLAHMTCKSPGQSVYKLFYTHI